MPESTTNAALLTERFERAFRLACELHRHDLRKSTTVPYLAHLMSVAALVLEDGGDEDEAIAGLLHDALEDHPDEITAEELEERFGARVRELVEACTDTPPEYTGGQKPPWRKRKERYIEHVRSWESPNRISLADKVHNARSILRDHRRHGDEVWERFKPTGEQTLWYYRSLVEAYRDAGADGYLVEELDRVVSVLEARAGGGARDGRASDASAYRRAMR
ncbi:MAG: HD domain-containing protein [Gemmatimonadota bacterium]